MKKTDLNKLLSEKREEVTERIGESIVNDTSPNSFFDEAFEMSSSDTDLEGNIITIEDEYLSDLYIWGIEELLQLLFNKEPIFSEESDNAFNSINNCIEVLNSIEILGQALFPKLYKNALDFCIRCDNYSKNEIKDIEKENKLLNLCKVFTLNVIKLLESRLNKMTISEKSANEKFEVTLNSPITDNNSIKTIPIDTLENILKEIKRVFPEFKLPDLKLNKDYASKALCNNLNYMIGGSAITSGCKALRDSEKWTENHLGKAFYQHNKADKSNSYITHYINDWTNSDEIKLMPYSEAEQILEKFGVYPALLHLILAVHFYRHPDPTKAELNIKGSDLIKDLGLHKRTDLSKKEKLERVNEVLTAVKSLIITAKWESEVTVKTGKKYTTETVSFTVDPSIMWNISSLRICDKDLFGNEELKDIEIIVKAGAWLSHFFNQSERELGKALYNFATLSRKILDLDPYHEELALRIALLQSTMDYRGYYTVEKWLNENLLGAKTKIADAKIDRLKRKKLADLWDKTLISLERIGFEIHFDNKTYPEELRPQSKRKPKGYFDRILQGKIKLTPESLGKPESDLDAKAKSISSSPKLPEKIEIFRGEDLRKKRESLGITQPMIAKYLFNDAKKKMYVSRIENNQNLLESKYNEILDAINYIGKNISKFK